MITTRDAYTADEFHIPHAGLPCTVWKRASRTVNGPAWGQFRVPVITADGNVTMHRNITQVNAGDFHTLASCPHANWLSG